MPNHKGKIQAAFACDAGSLEWRQSPFGAPRRRHGRIGKRVAEVQETRLDSRQRYGRNPTMCARCSRQPPGGNDARDRFCIWDKAYLKSHSNPLRAKTATKAWTTNPGDLSSPSQLPAVQNGLWIQREQGVGLLFAISRCDDSAGSSRRAWRYSGSCASLATT